MKRILLLTQSVAFLLLSVYSVAFAQTGTDLDSIDFNLQQTSFRDQTVTSFSLAGLGLDGGATALDVFRATMTNTKAVTVTGLKLKILVYLNDQKMYVAWSKPFPLSPNVPLSITNSIFFRHDGTNDAEWGETEFRLDEKGIAALGLTNLLSSPGGEIKIEVQLYQNGMFINGTPHYPIRYNIVTIPEITLLEPWNGATVVAGRLPLFRWSSMLDNQPGITGPKYRLSIYAPGSFSGGAVTGKPFFETVLSENYYQYTQSDPNLYQKLSNLLAAGSNRLRDAYAWRVTALLQGPGVAEGAYDERLKSELRTFSINLVLAPPLFGGSGIGLSGGLGSMALGGRYAMPGITLNIMNDFAGQLGNGGSPDPVTLEQVVGKLSELFEVDVEVDGEELSWTAIAEEVNDMLNSGYSAMEVTMQVDAGANNLSTSAGSGAAGTVEQTTNSGTITIPSGFTIK